MDEHAASAKSPCVSNRFQGRPPCRGTLGRVTGVGSDVEKAWNYWKREILAYQAFATAQASYLLGGGHYIRGGSQTLTNRLVALIENAGGVLKAGREARGVLTKDHCVIGVEHCARDGVDFKIDATPVVFGNACSSVLASLLSPDERAAFIAPFSDRRQSISLWTVSLGLKRAAREFGVRRYSTFVQPPWLNSLAQMREGVAVMSEEPRGRMPPMFSLITIRSTAA
jgi:all-trans-retinol 13,14-reductase